VADLTGDPRVEQYARLIVERSLDVRPGWQVLVRSTPLAKPLLSELVRLIARRGHPVHERTAPTLAELTGYAWILPVDQTELRLELEQLFVQEGVPLPANRIECTSMPTLRSLLLDSDVIAALPMLIVDTEEGLQFISTPLPTIRRAVGVTRVAETVPSPPAAAMLRHVRAAAASLRQTLGTDHAGA